MAGFCRPRTFAIWMLLLAIAQARADEADHPLVPVLKLARDGCQRIETGVLDYTCTLTRQERVNGRLLDRETMRVKIRHGSSVNGGEAAPFSVYVRFLEPAKVKGREVLYVEGQNGGKLIVRNGGPRFDYITTAVPVDSPAAMQHNRYPITEIGMLNLARRLYEQGKEEMQYADIQVKMAPGAKLNGRPCTLIQVEHRERKASAAYRYVRILIDDEMQLPVHYAAYDWPEEEGGEPELLERYTYSDIRLNVNLKDGEFDHRNQEYQFLRSFEPEE